MADTDEALQGEQTEEQTEGQVKESPGSIGVMHWIIIALVMIVCAGGGIGLSRLFAEPSAATQGDALQEDAGGTKGKGADDPAAGPKVIWYYDKIEPVVTNLDVPGATRFLRVGLMMEMETTELRKEEITLLIDEKKPLLQNWLNVYLGILEIEDCVGSKKTRIQLEITDAFNEELFPDSKPLLKKVLLKEFVIN